MLTSHSYAYISRSSDFCADKQTDGQNRLLCPLLHMRTRDNNMMSCVYLVYASPVYDCYTCTCDVLMLTLIHLSFRSLVVLLDFDAGDLFSSFFGFPGFGGGGRSHGGGGGSYFTYAGPGGMHFQF